MSYPKCMWLRCPIGAKMTDFEFICKSFTTDSIYSLSLSLGTYFNMRPLKMDSKYSTEKRGNNYTLTISEVRQNDLGDYTCTAVNKISEQQAQVVLTGKLNFEKYFQFCQII